MGMGLLNLKSIALEKTIPRERYRADQFIFPSMVDVVGEPNFLIR